MIEPVAPAEAIELPAALLEERHHRLQRLQRLDAVAGIIAPPRIRPARIARLAPGPEADQFSAPLRPARTAQRNVERKEDFVEGHGSNILVSRTRCSALAVHRRAGTVANAGAWYG